MLLLEFVVNLISIIKSIIFVSIIVWKESLIEISCLRIVALNFLTLCLRISQFYLLMELNCSCVILSKWYYFHNFHKIGSQLNIVLNGQHKYKLKRESRKVILNEHYVTCLIISHKPISNQKRLGSLGDQEYIIKLLLIRVLTTSVWRDSYIHIEKKIMKSTTLSLPHIHYFQTRSYNWVGAEKWRIQLWFSW